MDCLQQSKNNISLCSTFCCKIAFKRNMAKPCKCKDQTSTNRGPIRGSLLRQFPNHWYLSWVETRYWKPKIKVTQIPISILILICPNTNMLRHICACLMKSIKQESWFVNANFGCVNSNSWIPDHYLTCYFTLNKGQFPSSFWIAIELFAEVW